MRKLVTRGLLTVAAVLAGCLAGAVPATGRPTAAPGTAPLGSGPRPWASLAQHVPGTDAVAAASAVPVSVPAGSGPGVASVGSVQAYSTSAGDHLVVDFYGAFVPA